MRPISDLPGIILPSGILLLVDRVIMTSADAFECETDLNRKWIFDLHFPGDPVFPASLLIEAAGQALAVWAHDQKLRGEPRLVRTSGEFRAPVLPEHGIVSFRGTVRRRRNLCVGDITISTPAGEVGRVSVSLMFGSTQPAAIIAAVAAAVTNASALAVAAV